MLAVKAIQKEEDCPTQDKQTKGYNGPKKTTCGEESKINWLIGDKCEGMGLRCRLSRAASVLSFIIVVLLLVTLAFGSFAKAIPVLPLVKVSSAAVDIPKVKVLTRSSERSVKKMTLI